MGISLDCCFRRNDTLLPFIRLKCYPFLRFCPTPNKILGIHGEPAIGTVKQLFLGEERITRCMDRKAPLLTEAYASSERDWVFRCQKVSKAMPGFLGVVEFFLGGFNSHS